jgi:hypothetical protein
MADKPAGIVEIPESLGKDIDNGKLPAEGLPIEEVLHPRTVEQLHAQAKAAEEPISADKLVPITPAEAAARRTQHGETLPNMPVARRVKPAPFRRERVTGGRHGKTWQQVPARKVVPGDMTAVVGRVADDGVKRGEDHVVLTGIGGVKAAFHPESPVQVFRLAPQP